jgi:hypothetical protein
LFSSKTQRTSLLATPFYLLLSRQIPAFLTPASSNFQATCHLKPVRPYFGIYNQFYTANYIASKFSELKEIFNLYDEGRL